jgi:putative phosphoesterase
MESAGSGITRVGLISDTHGLLRPEAVAALAGSDLIIHAGDIGAPGIIERLERIARVVAVRGNVDQEEWCARLPATAVAEAGSKLIYVLHDIHQLDLDPAAAGCAFVISGHSHKPSRTERAGVVYLNPGSAGPRRFNLPIAVARLEIGEASWEVNFVDLLEKTP